MYIHPFWIGVASTLFSEMLLLIIYSIWLSLKGKMKRPIINIERAKESDILALIEMGIIYTGEDKQLHVVDKTSTAMEE